jgi:hypothetical protein
MRKRHNTDYSDYNGWEIASPDFQYIVRPGGQHPNATLLGLVFQFAF